MVFDMRNRPQAVSLLKALQQYVCFCIYTQALQKLTMDSWILNIIVSVWKRHFD